MNQASFSVSASFVATTLAVACAIVIGAYYASKNTPKYEPGEEQRGATRPIRTAVLTALAIAAWLAITAVMASRGLLAFGGSAPPPLARLVVALTVITGILAFSRIGARLSASLPLAAIVGFQAFRIPVELTLAALHHEGLVPIQMTYEGMNYDVVSGVSAIGVAVLAARGALPRVWLIVWNVMALVLLVTIVAVANLSMPGPFRLFHDGPSSAILVTAPFVWLPSFLVPAALFGHLLVFRLAFRRARGLVVSPPLTDSHTR